MNNKRLFEFAKYLISEHLSLIFEIMWSSYTWLYLANKKTIIENFSFAIIHPAF